MSLRPTQWINYVPLLVNRFQESILLIFSTNIQNPVPRDFFSKIWFFAQDYAALLSLLNLVGFFISARQKSVRWKLCVPAGYQFPRGISAGPALNFFAWFVGPGVEKGNLFWNEPDNGAQFDPLPGFSQHTPRACSFKNGTLKKGFVLQRYFFNNGAQCFPRFTFGFVVMIASTQVVFPSKWVFSVVTIQLWFVNDVKCFCVCVCVRERERERESMYIDIIPSIVYAIMERWQDIDTRMYVKFSSTHMWFMHVFSFVLHFFNV